jgi:hypothetical protein
MAAVNPTGRAIKAEINVKIRVPLTRGRTPNSTGFIVGLQLVDVKNSIIETWVKKLAVSNIKTNTIPNVVTIDNDAQAKKKNLIVSSLIEPYPVFSSFDFSIIVLPLYYK